VDAVFSLRNVCFSRGGAFRLTVESLDFFPGRLYALVGPNGSGKSSLLQLIAGLERPTSGDLIFCGQPCLDSGRQPLTWRQQVTLVHQSPYLLKGSVFSNLALGLKARGTPPQDRRQRIHEALAQVGLSGFDQRNVRNLSGGEQQRAALARALVLDPKMLLLDEPTANIDEAGVEAFEGLLKAMPTAGTCVVFASHDPVQPERLDAHILRLRDGRVEAEPVC
jgi:tungstate transport system ATP-binding protein